MELEEEKHSAEQKQQLPEITLCHQLSNHDPNCLTFQSQSIATQQIERQHLRAAKRTGKQQPGGIANEMQMQIGKL